MYREELYVVFTFVDLWTGCFRGCSGIGLVWQNCHEIKLEKRGYSLHTVDFSISDRSTSVQVADPRYVRDGGQPSAGVSAMNAHPKNAFRG